MTWNDMEWSLWVVTVDPDPVWQVFWLHYCKPFYTSPKPFLNWYCKPFWNSVEMFDLLELRFDTVDACAPRWTSWHPVRSGIRSSQRPNVRWPCFIWARPWQLGWNVSLSFPVTCGHLVLSWPCQFSESNQWYKTWINEKSYLHIMTSTYVQFDDVCNCKKVAIVYSIHACDKLARSIHL